MNRILHGLGKRVLLHRARTYVDRYHPLLIGIAGGAEAALTSAAVSVAVRVKRNVRYLPSRSRDVILGTSLSLLGVHGDPSRTGWARLLTMSKAREITEPEPNTIVVELSLFNPGDIDQLSTSLPFTLGVVTHVGSNNLEKFGDKGMVAHEIASLVTTLPRDGYAVLNIDDPLVAGMRDKTVAKVVTFGEHPDANVRITRVNKLEQVGFAIEVEIDGATFECHIRNLVARHQLSCIAAAFAVAHALDIDIKAVSERLRHISASRGCLSIHEGPNGSLLLDNSLDLSPESVVESLNALSLVNGKRHFAIVGDMSGLGAQSIAWHRRVGQEAAKIADVLVTVGEQSHVTQLAALESDFSVDTHHFISGKEATTWMRDYLTASDAVLVTGFRGTDIELVAKCLRVESRRGGDDLVLKR